MAKVTLKTPALTKTTAKPEKKKVAPKVNSTASADLIVKACEGSLSKLNDLDMEYQLQSEINWCLGSYHNDHNPIGLYLMAGRALAVFKAELFKKTKGVTARLVSDIEKALKTR